MTPAPGAKHMLPHVPLQNSRRLSAGRRGAGRVRPPLQLLLLRSRSAMGQRQTHTCRPATPGFCLFDRWLRTESWLYLAIETCARNLRLPSCGAGRKYFMPTDPYLFTLSKHLPTGEPVYEIVTRYLYANQPNAFRFRRMAALRMRSRRFCASRWKAKASLMALMFRATRTT